MCNILLPIRILCHNQGDSNATLTIRKSFVEKIRQSLPMQKDLTEQEKQEIQELFPKLALYEPELLEEIKKIL